MIFAVLALQFPNSSFRTPAVPYISFVRDTNVNLAFAGTLVGLLLFVIWANLMIAGTSNGVNLTDGLDGLATGASVMVFAAYVLISIWQFNQNCQTNPGVKCYEVRDAHDLAVVAACVMGACFGFLWWNASPAKIFMGDTGSLSLGGALAGLAITTRTELLVVILGGLFVIITLSVIIQVGSFKMTGKRVFRMAPAAASFRAGGMERGHHRDPVLDHRRPVRGAGPRTLLRRMGSRSRMSSSHTGQHASDPYEPRDHPGLTHRDADWAGLRVLVAGLGVSGFAAADALADRGALVTAVSADATDAIRERAHILDILDVDVRIGAEHLVTVPEGTELVVTSPGLRPDHPLLVNAAETGIPVWGEVELAWRMRPAVGAAPWITVTGTNGKTTTVNMLASILRAAGLRATSAGNVGTPLLEAVPAPRAVRRAGRRAVQLPAALAAVGGAGRSACLNVAPDHIDWHGSLEDYRLAKGRVYQNTEIACVYNVEDPVTEQLVMDADVVEGCRAIGFTLGIPGLSMVGLVDDVLADRAFVEQRRTSAAELATLADLQGDAPSVAPHYVANALAAAALARAYGVPPVAVRDGLRAFVPDPHRIADVAVVDDVRFVDDSKATNPHAAAASLMAFEHVVWVAGGLLKGAEVDELVSAAADRLRGVVLIGADRARIAEALARHAPDVPVVDVPDTDTGAMDVVITEAVALAAPGDVVLLAPAAASMDMFASYAARGDAFAEAVQRHAGRPGGHPAS